jgi:hypothetical protein
MDPRFQPAQSALATGDLPALAALFAADPDLATAVSSRSHPTLLQCLVLTMPPVDNLEALIDFLADHGAELSGPLIAASGMNNVRAIAKLLDRGARIDGNGHWSPLEELSTSGIRIRCRCCWREGHPCRTSAPPRHLET